MTTMCASGPPASLTNWDRITRSRSLSSAPPMMMTGPGDMSPARSFLARDSALGPVMKIPVEANPELEGSKRRVFAGGTLPVVVAGHDESAAPLLGSRHEPRVLLPEAVFGDRRDVRPLLHHQHAVRRHRAGGDVVAQDDKDLSLE